MKLSDLSKDVLVYLALDMDLESIIKLCQTSSKINEKICKNDNFWLNKLINDYNIKKSLKDAKSEYLRLEKLNPNLLLEEGIKTQNFKIVKRSIELGADLDYKIGNFYPISESMTFKDVEILNYLLNKSGNTSPEIIKNIFEKFEFVSRETKCIIFIRLYEIILPYLAKLNKYKNVKRFWETVLSKFEEVYKEEDCITDEFYNKWIKFYSKMAN